jgi:hypothetical protein
MKFATLVKTGLFVDKSLLIAMLLRVQDIKHLIFPEDTGKSTALSMLQHFCEPVVNGVETKDLFTGLAISKNEQWMQEQGKRSVLYMDLSDITGQDEPLATIMYKKMAALYQPYQDLSQNNALSAYQKKCTDYFLKPMPEAVDSSLVENALKNLYDGINASGKAIPLLLVDGYNETLFSEEDKDFFKQFFSQLKQIHGGAIFMGPTEAGEALPDRRRKITIRNDTFSPYFSLTAEQLEAYIKPFNLPAGAPAGPPDFPHIEIRRYVSDVEVARLPEGFHAHDEWEAYYREMPPVNYKLGTVARYIRVQLLQPQPPHLWAAPRVRVDKDGASELSERLTDGSAASFAMERGRHHHHT